ncbi:MAG: hypothetical protein M3Q80_02035 [bacterium]|nr:hypothetical protein [bacterium]
MTVLLPHLTHHAYLLVGSPTIQDELIIVLNKTHKIPQQANPDFFSQTYQTLTVDDARAIKSMHSTRPIGITEKKIFILSMNGITIEAQNALLKLLEEPSEYAHFFLIVPSAHILLPTVKSRLLELAINKEGAAATHKAWEAEATAFVKMNPAKRLEVVKKLIEEITKEKKSKQDAIDFLNAVQDSVYKEKGSIKGKDILETIETSRTYMNDRAPSVKMLLEYVALNLG